MAHRTSAASLHAARTILRNYTLAVRPPEQLPSGSVPNLKANEACLAVVIDYATNVFQVAVLRPEIRYWQERLHEGNATAPQLASFLQRLWEASEKLPKSGPKDKTTTTLESPAQFGKQPPQVITLSKPALEAARFIFFYYAVTPKRGTADEMLDRVRVAKLVEVSLGLSRCGDAFELARAFKEKLRRGDATLAEIKGCFRKIGVCLAYLPTYEEKEEELKLL